MKNPTRILHVVTIMNLGGIETFLMTLYRNIDRAKVQFDFLVHRDRKGFFDDEIQSLGGKIFKIRPLNPLYIFAYKRELNEFLNKTNYDIVHSHLNANSAFVLMIAKRAGVRYRIAHSHINSDTGGFKSFIEILNKIYINSVSNFRFSCSQNAGEWLFGKKSNYKIINNSIDSKLFAFNKSIRKHMRLKLGIEDSTILIGNIARFSKEKNHNLLIDVFNVFKSENENSKLLLIGDGVLKTTIELKVKKLGLSNDVIFIGMASNVNEFLSAMDVFVFPSIYEGLGIVAIEAQSSGLPVVMNRKLPKELDITQISYRLSLNDDLKVWSNSILKAYKSNLNRSSKIKEINNEGYDIKDTVKILEDFYQNI